MEVARERDPRSPLAGNRIRGIERETGDLDRGIDITPDFSIFWRRRLRSSDVVTADPRKTQGRNSMKTLRSMTSDLYPKAGCCAAAVFCLALSGGFAVAEASDAQAIDGNSATVESQASSGMRAYIDPETGELVQEAPAGSAQPQLRASEDRPELVAEPSPVAGGGMMIRLDNRFQAEFKANVDSDGKMNTECKDADHTGHNH